MKAGLGGVIKHSSFVFLLWCFLSKSGGKWSEVLLCKFTVKLRDDSERRDFYLLKKQQQPEWSTVI